MALSVKSSTLLARYTDNEESNFHAENYVLLASYFGTEEEQDIAYKNMAYRDQKGHACDALATECYVKINPYYKSLLHDVAKGMVYEQPTTL